MLLLLLCLLDGNLSEFWHSCRRRYLWCSHWHSTVSPLRLVFLSTLSLACDVCCVGEFGASWCRRSLLSCDLVFGVPVDILSLAFAKFFAHNLGSTPAEGGLKIARQRVIEHSALKQPTLHQILSKINEHMKCNGSSYPLCNRKYCCRE